MHHGPALGQAAVPGQATVPSTATTGSSTRCHQPRGERLPAGMGTGMGTGPCPQAVVSAWQGPGAGEGVLPGTGG